MTKPQDRFIIFCQTGADDWRWQKIGEVSSAWSMMCMMSSNLERKRIKKSRFLWFSKTFSFWILWKWCLMVIRWSAAIIWMMSRNRKTGIFLTLWLRLTLIIFFLARKRIKIPCPWGISWLNWWKVDPCMAFALLCLLWNIRRSKTPCVPMEIMWSKTSRNGSSSPFLRGMHNFCLTNLPFQG